MSREGQGMEHKVKHGLDMVYCIKAKDTGEGGRGKDGRQLWGTGEQCSDSTVKN